MFKCRLFKLNAFPFCPGRWKSSSILSFHFFLSHLADLLMAALSCCLRSELLCARAACLFSIKFQVASDKYACFCSVGILVRSFPAAWLIAWEKFLLFICTLSRDEQKSKFARMSSLNHICSLGFLMVFESGSLSSFRTVFLSKFGSNACG